MNFYEEVNEENALEWLSICPAHLKKQLDIVISNSAIANVFEIQKLEKDFRNKTSNEMGYDLPEHVIVNDTVEGNSLEETKRFELRKAWCEKYNEIVTIDILVKEAPRIQNERRMLSQALGLKQGGNGFPDQTEGLDEVTAATVNWITTSGETPLEYLAGVYRSPDESISVSQRVNAARALMDYVHRKLPQKQEVEQKVLTPKLDMSGLRGLSEKELETLEKLLSKISDANG